MSNLRRAIVLAAPLFWAGVTTGAAVSVTGLVPDWNQPKWHGANGPNGGPLAGAWGAWCVPTSAANVVGHWEDALGQSISDGAAYSASGVGWGSWPAYQDYQANGSASRGTLSPGSADDLGWYMDTNRVGDASFGNGAHVGTFVRDVSPGALGLNLFFADRGATGFSALTHGTAYADPQTVVLPNSAAGLTELQTEVNAGRTAIAHFSHWNILPLQPGPAPGPMPIDELDNGFDYFTFGAFGAMSDPELEETWNNDDGGGSLGHSVTVVGYIAAGSPDDIFGNQDWVIVHDNFSQTPRNVAVPFGGEWVANTIIAPEPAAATYLIGAAALVTLRRRRRIR